MPGPLLSPGSADSLAQAFAQGQEEAARWVEAFLAPGYGPHGGVKLLADGAESTWVTSAALALADAPSADARLQPYRDLARRIHRHAGDQATGAALLAARLVRLGRESGLPPAVLLDGLRLARRQSLAVLASLRVLPSPAASLGAVADLPLLAETIVDGLQSLGRTLHLDEIAIRAEPIDRPEWAPGVVAEPQAPPTVPSGSGGLLLLSTSWKLSPRSEGTTLRMGNPDVRNQWIAAEDKRRREAADHLVRLGVRFVACTGAVDEALVGRLSDAGVAVWSSAPLSALQRLQRATGSRPVATATDATKVDVASIRWVRRKRPLVGWQLSGSGHASTLLVPAHSQPARDAAVEAAERVLRAAGCVLASPGALPGGGRWQRAVAASLRRAAESVPGKTPLALALVAQAFDGLADDLVRNAGGDPMSRKLTPGAESVLDAEACVRLAVGAAFDTAVALLRLDGSYAKRSSVPADLRGGLGPSGSRRRMPGDLPPLM